jgi:hypothetical protein
MTFKAGAKRHRLYNLKGDFLICKLQGADLWKIVCCGVVETHFLKRIAAAGKKEPREC